MAKRNERTGLRRLPGLLVGALVALTALSCVWTSSGGTCADGEVICDDGCMTAGATCCHYGDGRYCPSGYACGAASANVCTAETCGQTCQDDIVAYAVDNTFWLLNNEDLAGIPAGAQDKTASCPLGGTVHITGQTSVSASQPIETMDLTLDLAACAYSSTTFALTFTGTLTATGTFSTDHSGPNAVTLAASALTIAGTVQPSGVPSVAVSETCSLSLTDAYRQVTDETGWLNGLLCGRTAGD